MPPAMSPGDVAPADGRLPSSSLTTDGEGPLGIYIHVPFCRVRCGYCDFNTYTAQELGSGGASTDGFLSAALAEMDLAQGILSERHACADQEGTARPRTTDAGAPSRPVDTIFVGGGTPTLLSVAQLAALRGGVEQRWGIRAGAEITTEANPDTLSDSVAADLAQAGFTRVSIGMQSAVPHVLVTLDRTHEPSHVPAAVAAVKAAGMQVSLDLIYGTPGESLQDWRRSVEAALDMQPDHISAYALTIEEGTAMGAAVRRGALPMPTDDDEADKYELLDELLAGAGYRWYEISNWSRGEDTRCQHNVAYWRGQDWWGIGPGAHSHIGGTRWWNVKHPSAYGKRLRRGISPALAREVLTDQQRYDEQVMLGVRLADGLDLCCLRGRLDHTVADLLTRGLLEPSAAERGYAVLTRGGRLLADTVVRTLLSDDGLSDDGLSSDVVSNAEAKHSAANPGEGFLPASSTA
ncbi:radical SAM family heme chaperone HemW [soil metagenome]